MFIAMNLEKTRFINLEKVFFIKVLREDLEIKFYCNDNILDPYIVKFKDENNMDSYLEMFILRG